MFRGDFDGSRDRAFGGQPGLELVQGYDPAARTARRLAQHRGGISVQEHQARATVVKHAPQCVGGKRDGQGRDDHSCTQGAQIDRHDVDRIDGADGDTVSLGYSIALQGRGDPVHDRVELLVSQASMIRHQSHASRLQRRATAYVSGQVSSLAVEQILFVHFDAPHLIDIFPHGTLMGKAAPLQDA